MKGNNVFVKIFANQGIERPVPSTTSFVDSLAKHLKDLYIPDPTDKRYQHLPSFYRCASFLFHGVEHKDRPCNLNTFRDKFNVNIGTHWNSENMEHYAQYRSVQIDIYQETSVMNGKRIELWYSLNVGGNYRIALLKSVITHEFAAMIPSKSGALPILYVRKCGTCGKWKGKGYAKHQVNCRRCTSCECAYKKGSNHATLCSKPHWDVKKRRGGKPDRCFLYKKCDARDTLDLSTSMFADFETFTPKEGDGKYVVYAAGVIDGVMKDEEAMIFWGMDALDGFMKYLLEHGNGYLWFFNGMLPVIIFIRQSSSE